MIAALEGTHPDQYILCTVTQIDKQGGPPGVHLDLTQSSVPVSILRFGERNIETGYCRGRNARQYCAVPFG